MLERIANHFMDSEWLRERRKEEVLAKRETQHIERKLRLEPPFEKDMFPDITRRKAGQS